MLLMLFFLYTDDLINHTNFCRHCIKMCRRIEEMPDASNIEKYENAFIESFDIEKSMLNEELKYESIPEWDSVGHMTMISNLEEVFDIVMEMDDIIDFSSFEIGKEILKKYKIDF